MSSNTTSISGVVAQQSGTATAPITYPLSVTKQIEFLIHNPVDHAYVTSQKVEDDIIADLQDFAANIELEIVSIDGLKL